MWQIFQKIQKLIEGQGIQPVLQACRKIPLFNQRNWKALNMFLSSSLLQFQELCGITQMKKSKASSQFLKQSKMKLPSLTSMAPDVLFLADFRLWPMTSHCIFSFSSLPFLSFALTFIFRVIVPYSCPDPFDLQNYNKPSFLCRYGLTTPE